MILRQIYSPLNSKILEMGTLVENQLKANIDTSAKKRRLSNISEKTIPIVVKMATDEQNIIEEQFLLLLLIR